MSFEMNQLDRKNIRGEIEHQGFSCKSIPKGCALLPPAPFGNLQNELVPAENEQKKTIYIYIYVYITFVVTQLCFQSDVLVSILYHILTF